ncbi:MAG: sodium:proton antiporter, partial [Shewanellaceae bacterium]|nr:sodium:proton antiporter [Shewanellaceae bacterium]
MEHLMTQLALIGITSLMCQWASWYLKIPSILFLLISGFVLGPMLGMINPDQLFSSLLFPFISMSVAIILFEGALTLNLDEIKGHGRMVTNLVSIGMLVTWGIVLLASYLILNISFAVACLFAAIVVVTGPTVIVPLIRAAKPNSNIANILRWEGILIDPLGALFAVLVYEFVANQQGTMQTFWLYSKTLIIGISLGLLTAAIVSEGLRKHWFPHYLINTAVMVLMLAIYVISNDLQEESGLLTVTVMGIALANKKDLDVSNIIEFKETLSVLLISSLFILLAARIEIEAFLVLGWEIFWVLLVIMLVARPLSVLISSFGNKELTRQELMFIAWVSPRGIVAAAVSALFAIKLEQDGIKGAEMLVPLVFSVIIGTVIVQSITSRWLVKL